MKARIWLPILFPALLVAGCQNLMRSPKYQFSSGYYRTYGVEKNRQRSYVARSGDTLLLSPPRVAPGDPNREPRQILISEKVQTSERPRRLVFTKASFDLDFITIPVRVRFARPQVPAQLNYAIGGALYLGRRVDRYSISYTGTPVGVWERSIAHYGLSFGPVFGISPVFVSPTNTAFRQPLEYDGLALTGGAAAILGMNGLSFGLIMGLDHLTDRNKSLWLYQHRPWLGLGLGLNLN